MGFRGDECENFNSALDVGSMRSVLDDDTVKVRRRTSLPAPRGQVETADVPSPDSLAHPHGLSPLSLQGVMPVPDNNYARIYTAAHIVDSPYSHVSACSLA
jgi:hypothetical protein